MIIDIHNHITVKSSPYHLPQDKYLKVMDELGIDKMVILGKDYGILGDQQKSNLTDEEVADFVKAHPDRFRNDRLSVNITSTSEESHFSQ